MVLVVSGVQESNMKLTPIIVTCGESETFRLLNSISDQMFNNINIFDKPVILLDESKVTKDSDFVNQIKLSINVDDFIFVFAKFEGDFSAFRNVVFEHITDGNIVLWLDADEQVSDNFFVVAYHVFKENPTLDLIYCARANYVNGITPSHVQRWGWKLDQFNRINYPDFQGRIHIKRDNIIWSGKVHEKLTNIKNYATLDGELEILHVKEIQKQEQQNELYNNL